MESDRQRSLRRREQARDIVAAYVNDQDADVYNLIDAGVREDPMGIGYALARLGAALLAELSTVTGRSVGDVLASLTPPWQDK